MKTEMQEEVRDIEGNILSVDDDALLFWKELIKAFQELLKDEICEDE